MSDRVCIDFAIDVGKSPYAFDGFVFDFGCDFAGINAEQNESNLVAVKLVCDPSDLIRHWAVDEAFCIERVGSIVSGSPSGCDVKNQFSDPHSRVGSEKAWKMEFGVSLGLGALMPANKDNSNVMAIAWRSFSNISNLTQFSGRLNSVYTL
jgi:hypothetical protein